MTKKDRIREAVFETPWATQQEIADDVDASRSTVADVVAERPELQQVRKAFRDGFDVTANPSNLETLAELSGLPNAVQDRLLESADAAIRGDPDLSRIRITLEPTRDDETHQRDD